ncbi:ABC transporter ATP-binding protein [Amycolatopsis sp. NPDC054798]
MTLPSSSGTATAAVQTQGLTRYYGPPRRSAKDRVCALDSVDLVVEQGEVRGLLGPNGAGKTTLCRILSTVLLPASGTARVLGHDVVRDVREVRQSVGIVFGGERGLYGRLTARQNLRFWGALYGFSGRDLKRRTDALLERLGLTGRSDDRVDFLSRGMKQRLHLARGLIADPPVLILDEPTLGMDPVAAQDFRVLVGQLRAERRTILLTTHDMAEAEAVCDRVTLIDHGTVLATRSPGTIGELVSRTERIEADDVPAAAFEAVRDLPGVAEAERAASGRVLVTTDGSAASAAVLGVLVDAGVTRLVTGPLGLEEVYLRLIGDRGMAVKQ